MNSFEANVSRTGPGLKHLNTLVLSILRIRLFDPFEQPMPRSPFRLTLGERIVEGKADDNAWLEVRTVDVPEQATIEWGKVDEEEEEIPQGPGYPVTVDESDENTVAESSDEGAPEPTYPEEPKPVKYRYEREIHLAFDPEEEKATLQRLHNLGFTIWETLEENIRAFQLTYKRSLTGKMEDVKSDVWGWHDDCGPDPFPQLEMKDKVT